MASWLWTFGNVPEKEGPEIQRVSDSIMALSEPERLDPAHPRIIDVRTEGEFDAGHIAGATNASFLPPWGFPDRIRPLLQGAQLDTPIYTICLSAHRSIGALKWLREQGYTNVHQLAGGMKAWRAAGMPETKERQ